MRLLNESGVGKICNFWPISSYASETVRDIGPSLLLITNRKLYTSFQLAPELMTLDDLEHQNRGFIDFLAISGCDTHFKSKLCRNHQNRLGQPAYEIFDIEHSFH